MDPLRSYLGRLLLEEITPVVMVLTTPLAEAACRKSGLSFVDMLSPFSLFQKIYVPVRTATEVPYRLQMFKIRMVYAADIRKEDYEVADERIKPVVSEANEKALPDLLSDPPQLEDVLGSIYNFSNYELQWKVHPSEGAQVDESENGSSCGGQGHPFYVTVLQSV